MTNRTAIRALLFATTLAGCTPPVSEQKGFASPAAAALDISHQITPIAQSKTMSCWAAAAAMMMTWKTHLPTTEFAAAQAAGNNFTIAFRANTGIFGPEIADLARALTLSAEAPQNYTARGYAALLQNGPLWAGTAIIYPDRIYRHVRIVHGIHGDGTERGSTLDIVDPDGGRRYRSTVAQFSVEMETIARQDLGAGRTLNPQILHY
jgi:hypothetical protein